MCQLYKRDISEDKGVWTFSFQEEVDNNSLKNEYSKRTVPIHKALIKYGLLRFVNTVKSERIFPELPYGRDGYGQAASKWFGRFKKEFNFDSKKVFHSFRHTFSDALKQKGVSESVAAALTGHKSDGITYERYGKEYDIKMLKKTIDKISFPLDDVKIRSF